jgi:protein MBA1
MRHIAAADSFPGIHVDPSLGWFRSIYLYASHAFQAQSLKPTAWIAPMRQEILEQYIQLNQAIVHCVPSNPKKRLGNFVMEPYMEEVIALAQQRKRDVLYRWNFHREVTPTRILSLRAGDGEFSKVMPETGSRIAIQALVRFDTEQVCYPSRFKP